MTPRTRTFWLLGHRWIGIVLGTIIGLTGLTGLLIVFEDEIDAMRNTP
ncbi:MAG: PepSY domain-containing protein [Rhodospirillaceae bacterium]|jgi:uncharacterized iron-regulated membrane protein|nr:PepSY domain-containing protein [Rhodospirillaceae bacterium]